MIREPIAIPSPAADHHHRQHPALTSNNNHNNSTIIDIDSSVVARTTDFFVDSSSPAMTGHGTTRRSRNPTTDALQDSSPLQRLATTTTTTTTPIRQPLPQHHNNNNNNNANDSPSVQSQISSGAGWQWEQNNNHDDHDPIENEEQALFEQRLCEDIYGVAVRKINQNGKSNLRYVKCCIVDTCELLDNSSFSNRSVSSNRSSRSSSLRRTGFSFKNNSNSSCRDDRSLERCSSSVGAAGSGSKNKYNNNHSTTNSTTQVLTWGKKKDVKIPLEKFVSVRKGKTTDRTKRNSFPASRILSLITEDPYVYSNLDIEAPTRLDRDKFARAFSRFLGIPLLEQQQQQGTTRTSDNDIDIIRSGDVRSSDNIMTSPQSIMKGMFLFVVCCFRCCCFRCPNSGRPCFYFWNPPHRWFSFPSFQAKSNNNCHNHHPP